MIDDSASFFSKHDRLARYRRVLQRFESDDYAGFGKPDWNIGVEDPCIYLVKPELQWLHGYGDIDLEFVHVDFPEWYEQRPDERERDGWRMTHITYSWANNWHVRDKSLVLKYLNAAIKTTEDSIIRDDNKTIS